MSDLLKMKNICDRNGDIRQFPVATNLKSARSGKDGWGEVVIAVTNNTVADLLNDKVIGGLYIISREEWEKEKRSDA